MRAVVANAIKSKLAAIVAHHTFSVLDNIANSDGLVKNHLACSSVEARDLKRNLLALITVRKRKERRKPVEALLELHANRVFKHG